MIKTMCCLGSATLGVLLLSACGSTAEVSIDKSIISKGETNSSSYGGFWWTYTDHNAAASAYHATISQSTSLTVALAPTADTDSAHGKVLKVTGSVPVELPWADVSTQVAYTIDTHWSSIYTDATVPAYPAAGLGFGFQKNNKPFDATQGGKFVGVAFDMKVGTGGMTTVWTSMPMVGTDLPDPGFSDEFPKPGTAGGCDYYTTSNTPATGYQTCFANYRKGYWEPGATAPTTATAYNTQAAPGEWKRFCTLFSEVGVPGWANQKTQDAVPGFDPTKVLKMQWDMFQPKTGTGTAYDLSVDNVQLITADQAADEANNCDPAMIDEAPGSGDQG